LSKFGVGFKLGEFVQITLGVKELEKTSSYYEILGFKKLDSGNEPWPWILYTDGENLIHLNIDGNIYTGLTYFDKEMKRNIDRLEKAGINFIKKSEVEGNVLGIFKTPDGFMVGLVNSIRRKEDYNFTDINFKLGNAMELSYSVKDLKDSLNYWNDLGFKAKGTYDHPYPWAIIQDGLITIGLHQSEEIPKRPITTYFSKNQTPIIKKIKEKGLKIAKSYDENNATLETPDGHLINIFQW
jgi:predicted lactoylglutathione lyase